MRPRTRPLLPLALLLAICACVPPPKPAPAPAPTPTPLAVPSPAPAPPPQSVYSDWRDAPQTPGDWRYANGMATYGTPGAALLSLRCDRAGGAVEVVHSGASTVAGPVMIRTETTERPVNGSAQRSDPPSTLLRFSPADPLLDAMAFSSGRFAVEVGGLPTLYVPSWPEVMRVIDDCR